MSELRRRKSVGDDSESESDYKCTTESRHKNGIEKSKNGKHEKESIEETPKLSSNSPVLFETLFVALSARWKNMLIRLLTAIVMVIGFVMILYTGPIALLLLTLAIQIKCFQEIISIGHSVYRVHGLPWFRSLSWYMLIASNYFLYGESLVDYFGVLLHKSNFMHPLVTYHRFISFSLYIIGFIWFVLSLVKKYYMRQFSLFAFTHVTLLIVVTQSYLKMQNMFEGLIWYIVPVILILTNDIMAYFFGFFCGRTPLIKVSPKKTWEGFIGGGVSTVILGTIISYYLCQYKYLICPIEYSDYFGHNIMECTPSPLFQLTEYHFPDQWGYALKLLNLPLTVEMYPFVLHSLSLSLFSSIIGPFGGFFASGFKRAFKVKDFSGIIPGHGGVVDRFDCMYLMATFVNVYISSFIRAPTFQKLFPKILQLKAEHQLMIFEQLKNHLNSMDMLKLTAN